MNASVSLKKTMYAATALAVVLAGSYAWAGKAAVRQLVQKPTTEMKWEEFYPGGPVESFVTGNKMSKVEELPVGEAQMLLGLEGAEAAGNGA